MTEGFRTPDLRDQEPGSWPDRIVRVYVMTPNGIFELRTYRATPGKLDALNARFRDHTVKLFAKHGMEIVGFWEPVDDDGSKDGTLVYVLAFESRKAATAAWASFREDSEWVQAKADSEAAAEGSLTVSVESVFMTPTDYSPIA